MEKVVRVEGTVILAVVNWLCPLSTCGGYTVQYPLANTVRQFRGLSDLSRGGGGLQPGQSCPSVSLNIDHRLVLVVREGRVKKDPPRSDAGQSLRGINTLVLLDQFVSDRGVRGAGK